MLPCEGAVSQPTSDEKRAAFAATIAPDDERIQRAFARVPREAFLPPGPWQAVRFQPTGFATQTTSDPYVDVPIVLIAEKQLTNGQPSAHAKWIGAAAPKDGERVIHIGAGAGFYTAILAELVGSTGRVIAYEIEPDLVAAARKNLAPWSWVEVRDSGEIEGSADVIYVSAGATHVPRAWLDALAPGGRMVIPITAHVPNIPHGVGMMLRIEHRGDDAWPATVITRVGIYDASGARDANAEAQVLRAFVRTDVDALSVVRAAHPQTDACIVHVEGSCIQSGAIKR